MNFYVIAHFLIAFISLLISGVVFLKNRRSIVHITLALFSFAIFFWAVSYGVWLLSTSELQALFWSRMLNLGATFIPVFLLHWILSFLGYAKKRKKIIIFYYILTIIFALFSFTRYYVPNVSKINQFSYWPQIGWLYVLFLTIVWIPILFYSFFLLIKERKNRSSSMKQQIEYILIGLVIGFLGGSTNYLLMFGCQYISPIGSILVVMFPILFAYAVVKHHLMDIKIVMRRYSVYLSSLGVVLLIDAGIEYLIGSLFPQYVQETNLIILIGSISVYPIIKNYFYYLANKYFFSSLYDSNEVIAKFSDRLRSTIEIENIFKFIEEIIIETFHTSAVAILIYNEKIHQYIVNHNQGFKITNQEKFSGDKDINEIFIEKNQLIIVEDIKVNFRNNKTLKILLKLGVEILVPLKVKNKIIGLIIIGKKESGDMYNEEDFKVLKIIGAQSAIALDNSLLYKKTKTFNQKMAREVKRATRALNVNNKRLQMMADKMAVANDRLRKLDNAKSEFISIASHQLRTPLTAIKGFVSLLLEGSYGEISKEVQEVLNKVYLSNERLIELVEDLLNISRIESGRIEYKFEKVKLENICQEIIDSFVVRAKEKHLKIELKLPKKSLPEILTDKKKIREVISNLVDNALKYTPKGWVKISLLQVEDKVQIRVSDTGIGIPVEEIPHLFAKFSRGKGISRINTGGTGLGLYVGKKIIESLHGRIWVESKGVNLGSTFIVEIPIEIKKEKAPEEEKLS